MPEDDAADEADEAQAQQDPRPATVRRALFGGIAASVVLAILFGWFGQQAYRDHVADRFRHEVLEAGKQGAINLTSIDYARAEADVQRVLDTSTGQFRADFKARSIAFIDVVKKAESRSFGTVTEAAVESVEGRSGQVLVAIAVKTKTRGIDESQPRYWRMRLTVTKDADKADGKADGKAKVSKVEFIR